MLCELVLAAALNNDGSGPPSDPDSVAMWIDDLGRLTPFGRTFDVYIQSGFDPDFSYPNGDPRRPLMIGSTRGNESPARSFGWAIEGPIFKNHRPDPFYPWMDNCEECIDYWELQASFGDWELPDGTVLPCRTRSAPNWTFEGRLCVQNNPYQRTRYFGAKFTRSTGRLKVAVQIVVRDRVDLINRLLVPTISHLPVSSGGLVHTKNISPCDPSPVLGELLSGQLLSVQISTKTGLLDFKIC